PPGGGSSRRPGTWSRAGPNALPRSCERRLTCTLPSSEAFWVDIRVSAHSPDDPEAGVGARLATRAVALEQPDDEGGAEDGEDEAARAAEQQPADDAAEDRATDADEDRLADGHGVGAGNRKAPESADYQSRQNDHDDQAEHVASVTHRMMDVLAEITANVWQVRAEVGQMVAEGDELVILESMKMEIP